MFAREERLEMSAIRNFVDTNSRIFSQNKLFEEETVGHICSIVEKCVDQLRIIASLKCKDETAVALVDVTEYEKIWNFVVKTMLVLKEDLKNNGSSDILEEILNRECRWTERRNFYALKSLESEIAKLEFEFNEMFTCFQRELSLNENTIAKQADELQKLMKENENALQYEKTWLQVQLEEDSLKYELMEKELIENITNLNNDVDEEEVVHSEITWYYENEEERVDNLICYWKGRFRDIDDRDDELKVLSGKQEKLHEDLQFYRKQYNKRQELMNEYLANKERRRKEYEYEQFLNAEATKIQAWWRGVMVRKYIGQFRYLLKAKSNRKRKMSLKRSKK